MIKTMQNLMSLLGETDIKILKTLPVSGPSFTPVFQALGKLGIDEVTLGDRLQFLEERGLVQLAGLGGSYAPGMTLSNGIHGVGLTARGRQFLKSQNECGFIDAVY